MHNLIHKAKPQNWRGSARHSQRNGTPDFIGIPHATTVTQKPVCIDAAVCCARVPARNNGAR